MTDLSCISCTSSQCSGFPNWKAWSCLQTSVKWWAAKVGYNNEWMNEWMNTYGHRSGNGAFINRYRWVRFCCRHNHQHTLLVGQKRSLHGITLYRTTHCSVLEISADYVFKLTVSVDSQLHRRHLSTWSVQLWDILPPFSMQPSSFHWTVSIHISISCVHCEKSFHPCGQSLFLTAVCLKQGHHELSWPVLAAVYILLL